MAEETKIAYAHSTFNGWIGCTEVPGNPQCGNCYAREMAKFRGWAKWGDEHPRMLTSEAYWRKPFKWNAEAKSLGEPRRVFAFSLGDVFDEFAPKWPQERLWPGDRRIGFGEEVSALEVFMSVIRKTPHLTWMIFTKRYDRAAEYLRALWGRHPWPNVWVMFSAGTQKNLDEAKRAHEKFTAAVQGISCEPSFEELDWGAFGPINWVIGGTESGNKARLTGKLDWFQSTAEQCSQWRVPFYMKQVTTPKGKQVPFVEWPAGLHIREFPKPRTFDHIPLLTRGILT